MATMRFTTWDRAHRLRAYHPGQPRPDGRHGQLWADSPATADGPDETFELVPAGGDAFGLRVHGVFVSMQPDGRLEVNRPWLRSWERFRLVEGVDGGRGLRSVEFGDLLAAERGGGDVVGTRVYDAPGPWETFTASGSLPGTGGAGIRGAVRRIGARAVGDDRGPALFVGLSRFYHGHAMTHDRDRVRRDLDVDAATGYDYVRPMFQVGSLDPSDYWAGVVADHNAPSHRSDVRWYLEQCRERGMRVLATLIGKGNGMDRQSVRREYVRDMAQILRDFPDVVLVAQALNEPGIMGRITRPELFELEAIIGQEAPGLLTSTGGYGDEPGAVPDDMGASFGMVGTPHLDRDTTKSELQDRPWRQPWDIGLMGRPWVNDEPIGPGASVATEERPRVLRSHATVSYIAGAFGYCYHADPGIRGVGNLTAAPGYREAPHAKRYLPGALPNGAMQNANANFPNRHWDLDSRWLRAGNGNTRGIVRAYGTQLDGRQYTVPFGPVSDFELIARRALRVECLQQDLDAQLWTRDVGPGEVVRWSAEHPDYLLISTVL